MNVWKVMLCFCREKFGREVNIFEAKLDDPGHAFNFRA